MPKTTADYFIDSFNQSMDTVFKLDTMERQKQMAMVQMAEHLMRVQELERQRKADRDVALSVLAPHPPPLQQEAGGQLLGAGAGELSPQEMQALENRITASPSREFNPAYQQFRANFAGAPDLAINALEKNVPIEKIRAIVPQAKEHMALDQQLVEEYVKGGMQRGKAILTVMENKRNEAAKEQKVDPALEAAFIGNVPNFATNPKVREETFNRFATDPKFKKKIIAEASAYTLGKSPQIRIYNETTDPKRVNALVDAIYNGTMAPSQVAQGRDAYLYNDVIIEANRRGIDLRKAEANYKGLVQPAAIAAVQLIKAVEPIMTDVETSFNKLNMKGFAPGNWVRLQTLKTTNDADLAAFEMSKNKLIEESERALTGAGAMADERVQRNLKLLKDTYSPAAMRSALAALDKILQSRVTAVQSPLYPDVGGGQGEGKILDRVTAESILKQAGGDKDKARAIAKKKGYKY